MMKGLVVTALVALAVIYADRKLGITARLP